MPYSLSRHYKLFILLMVVGIFTITSTAFAFCKPFWPPERIFTPNNDMHAFIEHDGTTERMVVQPAFQGNVDDFGLIVAFPSQPAITEAPEQIFEDLENLTNPFVPTPFLATGTAAMLDTAESEKSVTIIEQKTVGDFVSTVLTATSTKGLLDWLDSNDYSYDAKSVENFDYYVDQGGHYFVALKVDTSVARAATNGTLIGKLRPIQFAFTTTTPIVPLRIMSGESGQVSLTLFTLADEPIFVPGTTIEFSRRLTKNDFPTINCFTTPCPQPFESLLEYDAMGRWLMRHNIELNPAQIVQDVPLQVGVASEMAVNSGIRVFDSELTPPGVVQKIDPNRYPTLLNSTRLLRRGVRGNDVRDLQKFLNDAHGSGLAEDGIWGPLTERGVRDFQTQYNLLIDGIVGPQTRGMIRQLK